MGRPGPAPALTDPDGQQRLEIQLAPFLSKGLEREAAQEEAPREGRQAVPVPEENTRAFHTTGVWVIAVLWPFSSV